MKLTPEQIDRMPAGKEMEALIAEKIMEWRRIPAEQVEWVKMAWAQCAGPLNAIDAQFFLVIPHGDGTWHYGSPSWFSTDIHSIWDLVEKMKPLRLWLIDFGDYWQASFLREDSGEGVKANGDTPMLAICRAALKAKLEEDALNKRGEK